MSIRKLLPVKIGPNIEDIGIDEYEMATSLGVTINFDRRLAYGRETIHAKLRELRTRKG